MVISLAKPAQPRDREATEKRLIEAARAVLGEGGFQNFGVNAVARRAGCDKQLIYRYFGGLGGLLDRIGRELADWLGARLTPPPAGADYAGMVEHLVLAYLDALRGDPLMLRITLWELAEPSAQLRRISQARSVAIGRWMAKMRGRATPPAGIDAPAINALLIGAVQILALSEKAEGRFAGLDLSQPAGRERLRAAVVHLFRAAYAAPVRH
jgi:AcrR family transcriptional regulator